MAHPNSEDGRQRAIDENPFDGLLIGDTSILNSLKGRHPCPKCDKSRKYFCYTCYVPISELEGKLPKIKLPIKIDIIKHKHEIDGKSTAAHAAVLAPEDVSIYTYPDIPSYEGENVVLIFPSYNAVGVSQLFSAAREACSAFTEPSKTNKHYDTIQTCDMPKGWHHTTLLKHITNDKCLGPANTRRDEVLGNSVITSSSAIKGGSAVSGTLPISKAVFIDSTWNQSKGIYKDERIKGIRSVVIQNRISQFWRHQKGSPRWYLATIEAIHQFLLEVHLQAWGLHPDYTGLKNCFTERSLVEYEDLLVDNESAYRGQYDDLLYFFKHLYDVIHLFYDHDNLYAYKRRLM